MIGTAEQIVFWICVGLLGYEAMMRGTAEFGRNPADAYKKTYADNPFMQHRRTIYDVNTRTLNKKTAKFAPLSPLEEIGMAPITLAQSVPDVIVWTAANEESRAKSPLESDDYHRTVANKAVNDTQGGSTDINTTKLHENPAMRFFLTMFGTAFTAALNGVRVEANRGGGSVAGLAHGLAWYAAVPAAFIGAANVLLRGGGPGEDKDAAEWIKWAAKQEAAGVMSLHPVSRVLAPSFMEGKWSAPAGLRAVGSAAQIIYDTGSVATGSKATNAESAKEIARDVFQSTGAIGMPTTAPLRIIDGFFGGKGAMHAFVGSDHK